MLAGENGDRTIRGRGPRTVDAVMSLRWFGVLKKYFLENRGDYFKATRGNTVTYMDAEEMLISGPTGTMLKAVGVKAMADDAVYILGDDVTKFASLNFIRTIKSPLPDGNEWYAHRSDTEGYTWTRDIQIYGDLMLYRPAGCAYIKDLPDPTTIAA